MGLEVLVVGCGGGVKLWVEGEDSGEGDVEVEWELGIVEEGWFLC